MSKRNFFEDVYELVKLVPKGKVTTYGAIAEYLGSKGASRMVGWALNQCNAEGKSDVPAHRVVNRQGLLSGKSHFRGVSMEDRLRAEGVEIKDNQIQNFEEILWIPSKELL